MTIQIIEEKGKPAFAVVPYATWLKLQDALHDKADAELVRRSIERKEEAIPAAIANRIFAGENAIKAFRDWRGMTQEELAKAAGTSAAYLSQIETGLRNAGSALRRRLAATLRVDSADLATTK